MKKILLIAILFTSTLAKAQTTKPIEGFLGIKFGTSAEQVIEAMKAKGALPNNGQTPQSISFNDVNLGTRKASTLFIHLVNGVVYESSFVFRPTQEAQTIEFYNALSKDISEAYGPGKETKTFNQPYKEGDGYEITALKSGNAHYATSWYSGENHIQEEISLSKDNLCIRLYYTDGKLDAQYKEQQKAKNKSDL